MAHPDKRERILQGAVRVFARRGFYNSKVSEIAREAGVADGTIYLYFKSKDDILIQLFVSTVDELLKRQEESLEGVTGPVQKLRTVVDNHFAFVADSAALAEVITVEFRQSSKFMRGTDMKPFGRYLGIIARIVEEGQQLGTFRAELQPRRMARMLFGAIDELALEWAMGDRTSSLKAACTQTIDTFLYGLVLRQNSKPEGGLA